MKSQQMLGKRIFIRDWGLGTLKRMFEKWLAVILGTY